MKNVIKHLKWTLANFKCMANEKDSEKKDTAKKLIPEYEKAIKVLIGIITEPESESDKNFKNMVYKPFGELWKKEVMKMKKSEIVRLFAELGKQTLK